MHLTVTIFIPGVANFMKATTMNTNKIMGIVPIPIINELLMYLMNALPSLLP